MIRLALHPASQSQLLSTPRPSRLVTTLEVLTVAACLALGAAFVGTLISHPAAPTPDATVQACPAGSSTPC